MSIFLCTGSEIQQRGEAFRDPEGSVWLVNREHVADCVSVSSTPSGLEHRQIHRKLVKPPIGWCVVPCSWQTAGQGCSAAKQAAC